jgi:hypothetical protein
MECIDINKLKSDLHNKIKECNKQIIILANCKSEIKNYFEADRRKKKILENKEILVEKDFIRVKLRYAEVLEKDKSLDARRSVVRDEIIRTKYKISKLKIYNDVHDGVQNDYVIGFIPSNTIPVNFQKIEHKNEKKLKKIAKEFSRTQKIKEEMSEEYRNIAYKIGGFNRKYSLFQSKIDTTITNKMLLQLKFQELNEKKEFLRMNSLELIEIKKNIAGQIELLKNLIQKASHLAQNQTQFKSRKETMQEIRITLETIENRLENKKKYWEVIETLMEMYKNTLNQLKNKYKIKSI